MTMEVHLVKLNLGKDHVDAWFRLSNDTFSNVTKRAKFAVSTNTPHISINCLRV